ncbi:MAG: DUF4012 domain-containing protein [bacterium]
MALSQTLSVERETSVVVILGNCPIKTELIKAFSAKNIDFSLNNQGADYCIYWDNPTQVERSSSRSIYIHTFGNWSTNYTETPNSRHIFLGSLFGTTIIEPTLSKYRREAQGRGEITLSGDGVEKQYLLSVADAVLGIVAAAIHPRANSKIYLLGIEYSSLSLAYHVRQHISGHVNVVFSEAPPVVEPELNWDQIGEGLESLNIKSTQTDRDLDQYLNWLFTTSLEIISQTPIQIQTQTQTQTQTLKPVNAVKLTKFLPSVAVPSQLKKPKFTSIFSITHKPKQIKFEPITPPAKPAMQARTPKTFNFIPKFHLPSRLANILAVLGISCFLYISSIIVALLCTAVSFNSLRSTFFGTATPNFAAGKVSARYLQMNIVAWNTLPFAADSTSDLVRLIDAINQSFPLIEDVFSLRQNGEAITTYIFSENTGGQDPVANLNQSRLLIEGIYNQLSLIQGILPQSLPSITPSRLIPTYKAFLSKLVEIKQSTLTIKAILSILPDLIGLDGRRSYALLLQNNMELRPTGGFIGSFALPSFDKGRLYDLPVYDVYQADGQLKGHVEPPVPIRKYLGEANWYLRDSNWDPDFPTTGARVDWYLKKTLNQDVDGVIGINISVIERLLRQLGPIQVPEYNEEISADNLYARTQYHAEVGFFPGSTQKKEFLSSLVSVLMARIKTLDTKTILALGSSLLESTTSKDISISLDSTSSQAVIHRLGWDGQIQSGVCDQVGCLSDYLNIVDANVGVNKANYFLKRKISLSIDFDSNFNALHTLKVDQENTAPSSSWPAGPYKNYQRLYLPKDAELISLKRDGIEVASRDIDVTFEHDKKILGYLVNTPISGKSQILASYRLGVASPQVNPKYSFYWQKQPGTSQDPLNITLSYPSTLNPTTISPAGQTGDNQLIFNLDNSSDRRVLVNFTGK